MPYVKLEAHLELVDPKDVTTTYNGANGCACGCGGDYITEGAGLTRRVNVINKAITDGTLDYIQIGRGVVIYEKRINEDRVTRVYVEERD